MDEQRVLAILNDGNNWTANVTLTSPLTYNYCKIIANTQCLITTNFLKTGYVYDGTNLSDYTFSPKSGLALAGSKLTFKVNEKNFNRLIIQLAEPVKTDMVELQIVFYFFNSF